MLYDTDNTDPTAVVWRKDVPGLTALAVVRAVYVSATLGRPVAVDDVLGGAFDDVAVAV